jgi:murein DD-endopeptidase MepM/ murein hydrolase activator NlpD
VKECEKDLHLGKFIRINHDNKLATLYGHLLQQNVKVGQNVKRGDLIGLVGNSGMSTGYHLHYEVCKDNVSVNPYQHILNLNTSSTMMAMQ